MIEFNIMRPNDLSVGVEVEFFFIERATGLITERDTREIICTADRKAVEGGWGRVEPESKRCMGEIVTGKATTPVALRIMLNNLRDIVERSAEQHDLVARFIGVPPILPFGASLADVTQGKPGYLRNQLRYGNTQARKFCAATHIHCGTFEDDGLRIEVANRMRGFIPLFAAISASSPFDGANLDPVAASYRLQLLQGTPGHYIPDTFESYTAYREFVSRLVARGDIGSSASVWSYVRPAEDHPTVELRVMDAMEDVELTLAITGLYASLVSTMTNLGNRLNEFCFEQNTGDDRSSNEIEIDLADASNAGVYANIVDPFTGQRRPLGDVLSTLIEFVRSAAVSTGWELEVNKLPSLLANGGLTGEMRGAYITQRMRLEQSGITSAEARRIALASIATKFQSCIFNESEAN